MSEVEIECFECSRQYQELLAKYHKLKKKCRKMRKLFARIEEAVLFRQEQAGEFIVGECEAYRGKYKIRS